MMAFPFLESSSTGGGHQQRESQRYEAEGENGTKLHWGDRYAPLGAIRTIIVHNKQGRGSIIKKYVLSVRVIITYV